MKPPLKPGDPFSVLLPVYNDESTLADAVRSILEQTYTNFELLVIDDGSTDGTPDVVAQFDDERLRYNRKENSGLGDTLNQSFDLARHEWCARMDGDDIALPDRFEKQVNYLAEHPEIDILSSWYALFRDRKLQYMVRTAVNHEDIAARLYLHSEMPHSGVMYTRSIVRNAGGYDNIVSQDYELWNRLRNTARFANIPEVLLLVRDRPGSLTRSNFEKRNATRRDIQQRYYTDHEDGTGREVLPPDQLAWQEYFHGDRRKARALWRAAKGPRERSVHGAIAYCMTYLPDGAFARFLESRTRFRLKYLAQYRGEEERHLRQFLSEFWAD